MGYWDIHKILPYQRKFNFINGPRSIGKTYTALKYLIKTAIERDIEFAYVVRTQSEKKENALQFALEKVLTHEFSNLKFNANKDEVKKADNNQVIARCIALSEAFKIKKRSYPRVKYIILDEYLLEPESVTRYVNGWNEPDLFLSIYHTIDRDENKVICFFLGNNIIFNNPYHIHPAFNIPMIPPNTIYKNKYVLFQRAINEVQSTDVGFKEMVKNTKYGKKYLDDDYGDNESFIEKLKTQSVYVCTLKDKISIGVYYSSKTGKVYFTDKVDNMCTSVYNFNRKDLKEHELLVIDKSHSILNWIVFNYKRSNIYYSDGRIKALGLEIISKII